jgi:hypothetical protein
MEWKLNKFYEPDGFASDGGRNVELEIDTDVVLENLNKMATTLTDERRSLLDGFTLGGAWKSSNATMVEQKIQEISDSFDEMLKIIEDLKTKVDSYVQNTIEADTVNINGQTG